ncbi:helix-turn-helix domain-containing protein [Aliamphritea spongicola]
MRHWEMLHQVCQCGTLRQAAQVMGISQSALSHRLAEAERRLGGAVFERQGRVLKLTPPVRCWYNRCSRFCRCCNVPSRTSYSVSRMMV